MRSISISSSIATALRTKKDFRDEEFRFKVAFGLLIIAHFATIFLFSDFLLSLRGFKKFGINTRFREPEIVVQCGDRSSSSSSSFSSGSIT